MMRKYKLRQLIEVTRGASLPGEFYSTSGDRIRLTLGNFDYVNNGFKENTSKDNLFYTGAVAPDFILNKGDIITPLTEQAIGLLGSTAKIPESGKYIQSQDVALVKVISDELIHDFAYYLLPTPSVKRQLSAGAQQTNIRHTSPDKIKDCVVFIPEPSEQKKIASFLDQIERKLEICKEEYSILESYEKLHFEYWFLQFDFPSTNGKPYKSSGGKMVFDAELNRIIPEGWSAERVGKHIISSRGQSYDGSNLSDDGLPMLNLASFKPGGGYNAAGLKRFKGVYSPDKVLKPFDLIMCNTQQTAIDFKKDIIGNVLLVPDIFDGLILSSHHVTTLICDDENLKYYYYCLFNTCWFHQYIAHFTNGTNILGLIFKGVEDYLTPIPPKDVLVKFTNVIKNIETRKSELLKEIKSLSDLKDFVLPLLMNGQAIVK